MDCEVSCPFKEWDSLSYLLRLIPEKGQRLNSISTVEISITAIDVRGALIMVGTNMTVLYLIDRRKRSLIHKFKCGNHNDEVTAIMLFQDETSTDLMYSLCGTLTGQVFVHKFTLDPETATVVVLGSMQTQIVNQVPVTSLQFAPYTLYIGDESGLVTVLDVSNLEDTTAGQPVVLLNESQPVTQLSLHERQLIVSTLSNSVIFNLDTKLISKIGTKPRKSAGYFGGCFSYHRDDTGDSECLIFSPRPGLRLWRCTRDGTVVATHMYKELLPNTATIKLSGESGQGDVQSASVQLGRVMMVDNSTLISWGDNCVIIVDVSDAASSVLLGICHLPHIQSVICDPTSSDVFILGDKTHRRLHRLSRTRESLPTTPERRPIHDSVSTNLQEVRNVTGEESLPPVVKADDLTELSLSNEVDGGKNQEQLLADKELEAAEPKLKFLETKLQSGLSTVKEKLTITTTDMKQVRDNMKVGFGSLFSKIQNINLRKSTSDENQEEGTRNQYEPAIDKSVDLGESSSSVDSPISTKSEHEARGTSDGAIGSGKGDNTSHRPDKNYHSTSEPALHITAATAVVDDDDDLVTRFAPDKHSPSSNFESSPKVNRSTSAPHTHFVKAAVELRTDHKHSSDKLDEPDCAQGASEKLTSESEGTNDELDAVSQTDEVNDADMGLSNANKSQTEDNSDITLSGDDHSGEDLLRRLRDLQQDMTTQQSESPSYDLLIQSQESQENPSDSSNVATPEKVLSNRSSGVSSHILGRSLSINHEVSDSEEDEDDIYKSRDAEDECDNDTDLQLSFSTSHNSHEAPQTSNLFSSLAYHERWTCEALMSTAVSITLTNNYIWVLDKNSVIWTSRCKEPGFIWKKLEIKADQLSVAPSGCLAWRVYKNVAYAGHCKVPPYTPMHMKWTEAVKHVQTVAVDENCAWYIRKDGQVWLQSNLSRNRPIIYGSKIDCKLDLVKISTRNGVTWALTKSGKLYSYTQISSGRYDWVSVNSANNICDLSLSHDGKACWVIDSDDIMWYMCTDTNESVDTREDNSSKYTTYQVNFFEPICAENRHKFRSLLNSAAASLTKKTPGTRSIVSVSDDITAVCHSNSHQDVNICRTHVIGYYWRMLSLSALSSTAKWKSACSINSSNILAIYETGEIFCINLDSGTTTSLQLPQTRRKDDVTFMTSCSQSVWLINSDYKTVYYSTDIADPDSIRLGIKWRQLDTLQFGDEKLVHISVGQQSAWAVTESGGVYMCLGINSKSDSVMSPAWIEIDSLQSAYGPGTSSLSSMVRRTRFQAVYVNDTNTNVWAVDTDYNVYVRKGVTSEMPVGVSWIHIIGVKTKMLCLSGDLVWAVTDNDHIVCRVGITADHIQGEHWKQIPTNTTISHITVSEDDKVIGLSRSEQLVSLIWRVIGQVKERPAPTSDEMEEDGWQLV